MVSEWAQAQLPNYNIITFFIFLKRKACEVSDYSHCIHNWPVTREISNSFKVRRVGPARW